MMPGSLSSETVCLIISKKNVDKKSEKRDKKSPALQQFKGSVERAKRHEEPKLGTKKAWLVN